MKTVCFTGRRPKNLCGYESKPYQDFVKDLTYFLDENFYQKGICNFISGGAIGFDQLAFWSVNHLKEKYNDIKNIVYIPFKEQALAWSKVGVFSQQSYALMLEKADKTIILSDINNKDQKQVIKALYNRNHEMINDSDILIALYPDDAWMKDKGGTCEAMRYAYEQGKPIYQICYEIKENKLCFNQVKFIEGKTLNKDKENDLER